MRGRGTMAEIKEVLEDENKISTVVGDDIELRGRLVFKNSLKLKGFFEGKIESKGHLIIGQEATVSAEIRAGVVSVNGRANGKIKAAQRIELFSKSVTNADLVTPELTIDKGAVFNGTCVMSDK
ncbi:MAG: cell division protein [Spirochaetes bacterium]|nr:MAG: cell division protein [Spirochaetota bacterium]